MADCIILPKDKNREVIVYYGDLSVSTPIDKHWKFMHVERGKSTFFSLSGQVEKSEEEEYLTFVNLRIHNGNNEFNLKTSGMYNKNERFLLTASTSRIETKVGSITDISPTFRTNKNNIVFWS